MDRTGKLSQREGALLLDKICRLKETEGCENPDPGEIG